MCEKDIRNSNIFFVVLYTVLQFPETLISEDKGRRGKGTG